jgi:transposase
MQQDLAESLRLHALDRAELIALRERCVSLEAEVRRGKRQATPFSRNKRKSNPKKPGRRAGEGTFAHRNAPSEKEIKETRYIPLDVCPHCQGPVSNVHDQVNYQIDIPPIQVDTICFKTQVGYCNHCQCQVRSSDPDQIGFAAGAAATCIGPNAKAFAADLKHRLGVPYAKICEIYETIFGLKITPSALCQAGEGLAKQASPIYDAIVLALRECECVHGDETGWRINTLSAWLWTFTSRKLTVYTVDKTRSHDVILRVLGREFKGTLTSDCFKAYDDKDLRDWLKQKCLSHLIKDLKELEDTKSRGAVRFSRDLLKLFREAIALKQTKEQYEAAAYQEQVAAFETHLDKLISVSRQLTDKENFKMAKRLRLQRKHLFTFLYQDQVEPTNNRAERSLRPAVIIRKTGGCNKTEGGAKTHAVLASLLVTAKQQGLNTINYLRGVLTHSQDTPSLISGSQLGSARNLTAAVPNLTPEPMAQSP